MLHCLPALKLSPALLGIGCECVCSSVCQSIRGPGLVGFQKSTHSRIAVDPEARNFSVFTVFREQISRELRTAAILKNIQPAPPTFRIKYYSIKIAGKKKHAGVKNGS